MRSKDKKRLQKQKRRQDKIRKQANFEKSSRDFISRGLKGVSKAWVADLSRTSPQIQHAVYRQVFESQKARARILPNPFPQNIASIARETPGLFVTSFEDNVCLTTHLLGVYAKQLSHFQGMECDFQSCLMRGDLPNAKSILADIRGRFGESLWLIEASLLLGELSAGITGNREYLAAFNEGKCEHLVIYIANILSQRVESSLSVRTYEGGLHWSLKEAAEDDKYKPLVQEALFRLSFHRCTQLDEYANYILNTARQYSLVDLFATFRRLILSCIGNGLRVLSPKQLAKVVELSDHVFENSPFSALQWLCSSAPVVHMTESGSTLLAIEESLLRGEFMKTLDAAKRAIIKYPCMLEFYELGALAASHLEADEQLLDLDLPTDSLSQEMFSLLFNATRRDPGMEMTMERLLKIAYSLDAFAIGNRLMSFFLRESGVEHHLGIDSLRLCTLSDVSAFALHGCSPGHRQQIRQSLLDTYPGNLALEFMLAEQPSDERLRAGITPEFIEWFEAAELIQHGHHDQAAALLQESRCRFASTHPHYRSITERLILTHVNNRRFVDAANEVIDLYIYNKDSLYGPAELILPRIIEGMVDSVAGAEIESLCWPLIYWIAGDVERIEREEYLEFVAVDRFLELHGVEKVSDYLRGNPVSTPRLIAFLHNVCTPRVMKRSNSFANTGELEHERLIILQFVLQNDATLRARVTEEIADLTKRAKLREAVQQIEASRIFVNDEGVKSSLHEDHEKKFERFVRYHNISNEAIRKQLDLSQSSLDKLNTLVFTDTAFSLFCSLFDDVRQLFVSSNEHGLQTYVSMRIRHGHLSAQLRGQFENQELVTRKTGQNSEYSSNDRWLRSFERFGGDVALRVDKTLKQFSRDVDDLVEEVNMKWIRIRDTEHPEGLFDFGYSDEELGALYMIGARIRTYSDFVDFCLDALWQRTAKLLERIRTDITTTLSARFTSLLAAMEQSIYSIESKISHTDFQRSVANCRTEIPRQMSRFAEWFTAAEGPKIQTFDFGLLVELASTNVQRIHPQADFEPTIDNQVKHDIDGKCFSPFCDIMFNLCDNVVQHAHTETFRPVMRFSEREGVLIIEVLNEVDRSIDLAELANVIESVNALDAQKIEQHKLQTEGNTGFAKIRKSLSQDLYEPNSNIVCELDEERQFVVRITMPSERVLL